MDACRLGQSRSADRSSSGAWRLGDEVGRGRGRRWQQSRRSRLLWPFQTLYCSSRNAPATVQSRGERSYQFTAVERVRQTYLLKARRRPSSTSAHNWPFRWPTGRRRSLSLSVHTHTHQYWHSPQVSRNGGSSASALDIHVSSIVRIQGGEIPRLFVSVTGQSGSTAARSRFHIHRSEDRIILGYGVYGLNFFDDGLVLVILAGEQTSEAIVR